MAKEKKICLDCDKSTQKDLPSESSTSSSSGMPCEHIYESVTICMNRHAGQISQCKSEWEAFKLCHEDNKVNR